MVINSNICFSNEKTWKVKLIFYSVDRRITLK